MGDSRVNPQYSDRAAALLRTRSTVLSSPATGTARAVAVRVSPKSAAPSASSTEQTPIFRMIELSWPVITQRTRFRTHKRTLNGQLELASSYAGEDFRNRLKKMCGEPTFQQQRCGPERRTVSRKSTTGIIIIAARAVNDFRQNLRETLRMGEVPRFRETGPTMRTHRPTISRRRLGRTRKLQGFILNYTIGNRC